MKYLFEHDDIGVQNPFTLLSFPAMDIINLYESDPYALITFIAIAHDLTSNEYNHPTAVFHKEIEKFINSLFFIKQSVKIGNKYKSTIKRFSLKTVVEFNKFCNNPYSVRRIECSSYGVDFQRDWYDPKM